MVARERVRETFHMMAPNGGVFSVRRAEQQPLRSLESGPVGSAVGAGACAGALGLPKVIAFDMRGTTVTCAVLQKGRFDVRSPYYVGAD